jgi:hypothetical protein
MNDTGIGWEYISGADSLRTQRHIRRMQVNDLQETGQRCVVWIDRVYDRDKWFVASNV